MKSNIYYGFAGFVGGVGSWLHDVGFDQAFTVLIVKTFIIAIVSTLTGLLVKKVFYKIFPGAITYKEDRLKKKI
jgi:hypothetical protein